MWEDQTPWIINSVSNVLTQAGKKKQLTINKENYIEKSRYTKRNTFIKLD